MKDTFTATATTGVAVLICLALGPEQLAPAGFGPDGEKYLGFARYLLQHFAFYCRPEQMFSLVQTDAWVPNTYSPPVYFIVLAGALGIWNSWKVALILNAVIFAITCWLGLKILNQTGLNGRLYRDLFVVSMALNPAYMLYNGGIQIDTLSALFCCGYVAAWMWAKPFTAPLRPSRFAITGLLAALAVLTRGNIAPFLAGFTALNIAQNWRCIHIQTLKCLALMLTVSITLMGGWAWRNYELTGILYPTGTGGAVGYAMAVNYAVGGTRAKPELIWPNPDRVKYAQKLISQGITPLQADTATDAELARRVKVYAMAHPGFAAKVFTWNLIRTFLASMFNLPAILTTALIPSGWERPGFALAWTYVFALRSLIFLSFAALPFAAWRNRESRILLPIWGGALLFIVTSSMVIPMGDRFRLPMEPFCMIFFSFVFGTFWTKIVHIKSDRYFVKVSPQTLAASATGNERHPTLYMHSSTFLREGFWWRLREIDRQMTRLGVRSGRCIDIGGGEGVFLPSLARRFDQVISADIDTSGAKSLVQSLRLSNIEIVEGPFEAQNFEAPFDAAVAADVLEHFKDLHAPVQAIKSLVKPGGYLFTSLPSESGVYVLLRRLFGLTKPADHYHSAAEVEAFLSKQGFKRKMARSLPLPGISLFSISAWSVPR